MLGTPQVTGAPQVTPDIMLMRGLPVGPEELRRGDCLGRGWPCQGQGCDLREGEGGRRLSSGGHRVHQPQ